MMKVRLFSFLLLFSFGFIDAQTEAPELLPRPVSFKFLSGSYRLKEKFNILITGNEKDELLNKSVARLEDKILIRTSRHIHSVIMKNPSMPDSANLLVSIKKTAAFQIGEDESYRLMVDAKQIRLNANTTVGGLRGLETIIQLICVDGTGYYMPEIEITDSPRFPWRGLMIDAARHFIPIPVLKRNIEAMAEVKMNVLHLHLTDNEGFRFESHIYPQLQGRGSNGKYYTQEELKDLVSFAMDRGILIVPEFDMPGHTKSWFAGYPELSALPGTYEPVPGYRIDPANPVNPANLLKYIKNFPTPAMDPSKEATYDFLDKFIGEVCKVFPSPVIHIGADENNGVVWKNNPAIVDFMTRNGISGTEELQDYFVKRIDNIIVKHGRTSMGWDEIFNSSISKSVIIQVWDTRAPKTKSVEILRNGNREINSRGYYLDLFMPAYVHYLNDPLPYNCPDSLKARVLGGEAAIWTELANEDNIEARIWPRAAAVAERLWSPAATDNVNDLYKRLFELNQSLAQQGLHHISNYNRRVLDLAGQGNVEALKILMDLLSPVKGYKRVMALFFNPDPNDKPAALDAVADIVNVDPETTRKFRMKVANYLNKPTVQKEKELREILFSWSKNHEKIDSLLKSNPKLQGIVIHSKNLAEISKIGIKALEYLHMNTKAPLNWTSDKLAVLKAASEAHAEVELSVVPEIEALVRQKLSPEQK